MQTDEHEISLAALRQLAQLVAHTLAMDHYFSIAVSKISASKWEQTFKRNPVWFEYYFAPPIELLQKALAVPGAREIFQTDENAPPPAQWLEVLTNALVLGSEAVKIGQDLTRHDGENEFFLGDASSEEALQALAVFKALTAETRARCIYGQGMHALIMAGRRSIDEGYLRAVSIDPTVQWHPEIVARVSGEIMAGKSDFAQALSKAAQAGPSKHIDKELNQLRYLLSLLHGSGDLDRLSTEDRYKFFCIDLNLYPHTGKDPKAGLERFIDRWKSSLLPTT